MVYVVENMCFNGAGCDPLKEMDEEDADEFLEENKDTYMGYLTMDESPGYVLFAKLGTSMFAVDGYQCHLYSADLQPADEEEEDDEEGEEGLTEGGLFRTATLPEAGDNMTGFMRPGRGQGLMDGTRLALFRQVNAADILQGGLGDCWLLSAFAALAEYPDALMALFQQRSLSDDGEYDITLFNFLQGQYQTVRVDDRLPVVQQPMAQAQCAYVRPTADGEIWTCLLEKAFATLFDNSYRTISGGISTTAFAALCGVSQEQVAYIQKQGDVWIQYKPRLDSWRPYGNSNFQFGPWPDGTPGNQPKSSDELHALLTQWDQSNFIMCANTSAGSDTEFSDQGIVQGHAYTLIGARRCCGSLGVNLVQVRNPWGRKEWTGDWSDNSPLWDENPDIKELLQPQASEDGAFWISIEDFAVNYPSVAVVFKDMGSNNEKVSNPKADERTREFGVVGAGLPGGQNLNIDLPKKNQKMKVKRRKKILTKETQKDVGACSQCANCSLS